MKESLEKFLVDDKSNGLYVYEMPTGSGKTYKAAKFIHDFLIDNYADSKIKRVFYLTPQRKNVKGSINEVEKIFGDDKKGWTNAINNSILHIQANASSVLEHLLDYNGEDEFTKTDEYRDLKRRINSFNEIKNSSSYETTSIIEDSIRNELEPKFRHKVEEIILKWDDAKTPEKRIAKIKKDHPWLLKVYPSILTSQRKVLFSTVDKFYQGNDPIVSKSYRFLNNDLIKDSIIFIDESDASKRDLLNQMIDNCSGYKIDLINLINILYHSTVQDDVPDDMFLQLQTDNKEKTIISAFNKLKEVLKDTYKTCNLKYQFKLDGKDKNTKQYFLFHDFTTTTIFGNENKKLYIKIDENKKLNIITTNEKDSFISFNELVRQLNGALNFFIGFVSLAAKNYKNYIDSQRKDKNESLQLEDSISSILSTFKLQNTNTLQRIILNDSHLSRLSESNNVLQYDMYTEGFEFYSFSDDDSHNMTTRLDMSFLDDTPEKFLLTLAKKTKVVLLSATALSKTVLGNFNIQYLEENLADDFCIPDNDTLDELKDKYDKLENRQTNFSTLKISINEENPETSVFQTAPYQEQFKNIIQPYSSDNFEIKRFCKVIKTIYEFIKCPSSRCLLLMTTRLLKDGDNKIFNKNIINKCIELINKELNLKNDVEIVSVNSSEFDKKKEDFKNYINSGKKVIVATSYNTVSTGQNLYYDFNENDVLEEYDIDSIYLEKPTYALVKIDDSSSLSDLTKFIYQIESLRMEGEISCTDSSSYIKSAFASFGYSNHSLGKRFRDLYSTRSVNNSLVAIIKQAIGRISRNRKKLEVTNIFVDDDVLNNISFKDEKGKLQTNEFNELLKFDDFKGKISSVDENELNKALTNIKISTNKYHNLMDTKKGGWVQNNMDQWIRARDFVLKHPTLSEDEYRENPEFNSFYFHCANNGKINSYYFSMDSEDGSITGISYNNLDGKNSLVMSSNSAGLDDLMKCTYIKNYFIQKGYAISFEKKDYILLPNIIHDIYRGALGEAAGQCIFESKLKSIKLMAITDPKKFEKFDFVVSDEKGIYVDFKYWSSSFKVDDDKYLDKCFDKLDEINGRFAFVINIFEEDSYQPYTRERNDKKIYVMPNLIKKTKNGCFITNDEAIFKIDEYLKGTIADEN